VNTEGTAKSLRIKGQGQGITDKKSEKKRTQGRDEKKEGEKSPGDGLDTRGNYLLWSHKNKDTPGTEDLLQKWGEDQSGPKGMSMFVDRKRPTKT